MSAVKKGNKYTIDATNIALGRVATEIAMILMGKNTPDYVPNQDNDHRVIVKNVDKLAYSGKKLEQKVYHRYSGYPGGLKTTKLKDLAEKNPEKVLWMAVRQMMPANKLRNERLKRLSFKK